MAILRILPEHKSNTTVEFAPRRVFSSSSNGHTGSINVIVNRSPTQRDSIDMREGLTNTEGPQKFSENTFEGRRDMIYNARFNTVGQGNIFSENAPPYNYDLQLGLLMDGANPHDGDGNGKPDDFENFPPELFKQQFVQLNLNFAHIGYSDLPLHPRNAYQLAISRSLPGTDFAGKEFRKKEIIRNVLDSAYEIGRPGFKWGYGNFNCLNFFKTDTSDVPAVVYPSTSNLYLPTSSLQIDFRLKVNRYPTDSGTIMHLPGAFAVSVITGSTVDPLNRPDSYKLLLQLGTDATGSIAPSTVDVSVSNADRGNTQIYQSVPMITSSFWHDCSIRFSNTENNATGSFVIDGRLAGTFEPTGSFTVANGLSQARDLLVLGSFFTGSANNAAQLVSNRYGFVSPLDAELHEVKISNNYRSLKEIKANLGTAVTSSSDLLFHLPVLYSSDSPAMQYYAFSGDVGLNGQNDTNTESTSLSEFFETTPAFINNVKFDSPFNTNHSNIGGICTMNSKAFLRDFAKGTYPILHAMMDNTNGAPFDVAGFSSQHILSQSLSLFDEQQRANLLVLPCDDGDFKRTYDVYPDSQLTGSVVDATRPEIIRLTDLGNFRNVFDSQLIFVDEGWTYSESEAIEPPSLFPTLQEMSTPVQSLPKAKDNPVTIPSQRFFDPEDYGLIGASERSSNMVVMFSIPTLFYGNRLRPGTIKLTSDMYQGGGSTVGSRFVKGNDYRMRTTLCDDGYGNIIRCDTSGSLATSNFAGSVYYEDGIIALKSPHLFNFGAHNFELEFQGVQNTHILELLVPVPRSVFNSSSNPNYNTFKPFADVNEEAKSFMYLSTLNFHDSNLNVVAKARMAQPVIKRINDKYLFRVKFDF